jgi:hypothetical protein
LRQATANRHPGARVSVPRNDCLMVPRSSRPHAIEEFLDLGLQIKLSPESA